MDLQILEIKAEPFAGGHVDRCKEDAKALATKFKCKVYFTHNSTQYIVDEEGSCAKLN